MKPHNSPSRHLTQTVHFKSREWISWICLVVVMTFLVPLFGIAEGFSLRDQEGKHMDILWNGKPVAQYQYESDPSSPERNHETYKPFLHLIDPDSGELLTKGPGGQFTHHRGIFIGWNRTRVGDQRFDFWHMSGTHQVHRKFVETVADANQAKLVSLVHWVDPTNRLIVEEQRTMEVRPLEGSGLFQVDFKTSLTAKVPEVRLDGDPEHAGIQYRPSNEVDPKKTVYLFPSDDANPKRDVDYPWVGETYSLKDTNYSVIHMNHAENPKQTKYSAYRDYGRFGAFFVEDLPMDKPLLLQYRFRIYRGTLPERHQIQALWSEFSTRSVQ